MRSRWRSVSRTLAGAGCMFLVALGSSWTESGRVQAEPPPPQSQPPIYVTFLWHMHQPIYFPYEPATATQQRGAYSYDLFDIFNSRAGAYTSWPVDAVQSAMQSGLPHAGAQVSFSGSLIENLNAFETAGWGFWGWKARWRESNWWKTDLGNPRLDLIGFGYHHPLMPLLDGESRQRQISQHKAASASAWNGDGAPYRPYSKGFFPPENAFASWMIPELRAEGVEWVVADNIHFQRACQGYPWNPGGNLIRPNPADQLNPDPADWTQLRDLWAPTPVSAGWSFRPHWVRHVDPSTGHESRVVAVPTARYMGNEDGRGGFGALLYERVMSQLEFANDDPDHPILIVLHHDGDNYGGGSDSYYHANWNNFLNWAQANGQRFVPTTIQDYVDRFPPASDDVIHVEPGSWSGADNGDAEFKKWLGDPDARSGYSPDVNSWAVMVAAANRVKTAGSLEPGGHDEQAAWRLLLNGFASDYWYWDGTEIWDSNPTRAANQATWHADQVLGRKQGDVVPPQVFLPQREPYNPGGLEWGPGVEPTDFEVWTMAYDSSGLDEVTLLYRIDLDGQNPLGDDANETLAGGAGVGAWQRIVMRAKPLPSSQTNPPPSHRAERFAAELRGLGGRLVDYYVEARDRLGNLTRSPLQHVKVGGTPSGPLPGLAVRLPASSGWDELIAVRTDRVGVVRWGTDGWQLPPVGARPQGSSLQAGVCETPLLPDGQGGYLARLGPFHGAQDVRTVELAVRWDDGSWDNNGGQDYRVGLAAKELWWDRPRLDGQPLRLFSSGPGVVHVGYDGWLRIEDVALLGPDAEGRYSAAIDYGSASVVNFALQRADGTWNNNGGQDFQVSR